MKITERILVDLCRKINADQLKRWNSGLKIERRIDRYVVSRLVRKPLHGSPKSFDLFYGTPREVKAFMEGFAKAVELATKDDAQ